MKLNKIYKITVIMFIVVTIVTIICKIVIYNEDNKLLNRTLYYYADDVNFDSKAMEEVTKEPLGCIKNNYIIQDYNTVDDKLLYGESPVSGEVVVTKKYCEKTVTEKNGTINKVVDNCKNSDLGKTITLGEQNYIISGILSSRYVIPSIFTNLKGVFNTYDTLLVNKDDLNKICDSEEYYYKIIFKSNKDLVNFNDNGNPSYFETDIYIRDYMTYLYILTISLLIASIVLYIIRRKNGIKKC